MGIKVVNTRPAQQSDYFAELLLKEDLQPLSLPLIELKPIENSVELSKLISQSNWIIFTSQNAATIFFDLLSDLSEISTKKIAAVGQKTADRLKERNIKIDFMPSGFKGKTLARELPITANEKALIPRGTKGRKDITEILKSKKIEFFDFPIYENNSIDIDLILWKEVFQSKPDWIVFTSPSIVESFKMNFEKYAFPDPLHIKIACLGNVTADAVEEVLGRKPEIISNVMAVESLIKPIKEYKS